MIYTYCWVINYILLIVAHFSKRKRVAAALSVLVLGAVVVLRGNVGVDMDNYVYMTAHVATANTEPLFALLLTVLNALFPTPLLAVTMGLGSIFVTMLLIYVRRADARELFILQAFFIPALFWGSSISGQRFGLAFTFILLALQSVRLKQHKLALALSVIAVFTHYSSVLFIVLVSMMVLETSLKTCVRFSVLVLVTSSAVLAIGQSHFKEKYLEYFVGINHTSPSSLSGLSIITVTGILLLAVSSSSLGQVAKARIWLVTVLFLCFSFIVASVSYGGLRLLQIVEVAVPYAALYLFAKYRIPFKARFQWFVIFAGLLCAGVTYRDMHWGELALAPGSTRSLPYTFFWQE